MKWRKKLQFLSMPKVLLIMLRCFNSILSSCPFDRIHPIDTPRHAILILIYFTFTWKDFDCLTFCFLPRIRVFVLCLFNLFMYEWMNEWLNEWVCSYLWLASSLPTSWVSHTFTIPCYFMVMQFLSYRIASHTSRGRRAEQSWEYFKWNLISMMMINVSVNCFLIQLNKI